MALRDILVHITEGADCAPRVALAVALARGHDAHLAGVFVEPPLPLTAYPEIPVPASVIDAEVAAIAARAATQAERFRAAAEQSGVKAEWRQTRADSVTALNVGARYVDLLICGQTRAEETSWLDPATTEHVIMESGRPVLVVPHGQRDVAFGRRVLIAWNGSRESVRAVHDALPLLTGAESVQVMVVNPHVGYGEHGAVPGADICLHLARHGINAEAHIAHADSAAVGSAVLAQATAIGADLLVMGAYGHSRLREMVLGGVTRHVLQHTTIPALLSH